MADLEALIEAVEAGVFPGDVTAKDLGVPDANIAILTFYEAFSGSMDAALALFKELLPDWDYRIESVGGKSKAFVSKPKAMSWNEPSTTAMSAHALLLATLKAVEAQR